MADYSKIWRQAEPEPDAPAERDDLGWPGRRTRTQLLPVQRAAASPGEPLPDGLRDRLGAALGSDLSPVRVHTGPDSANAAATLRARAYTIGQDVHFGEGRYDPASPEGERLIAHEVAHTVQQGAAQASPQCDLEVSEPGDAHEVEADRFSDAFAAGGTAAVSPVGRGTVSRAMIQRQEETGPSATPGSGETATKDSLAIRRTLAQKEVHELYDRIRELLEQTRRWLTRNWADYLSYARDNPDLGWTPSAYAELIGNVIGNAVTDLGPEGIAKYIGEAAVKDAGGLTKWCLARAGMTVAPVVGTVVGFFIGVLVEEAVSAIYEQVTGFSVAGDAAHAAARRTALQIVAKDEEFTRAAEITDKVLRGNCNHLVLFLTQCTSQHLIDDIAEAVRSAKATVKAPPSGDGLCRDLLREWVLQNAGDEEDANKETDERTWESARERVFDDDGAEDLDGHPEIFAHQCHHEWTALGLPPAAIQAFTQPMIAEAEDLRRQARTGKNPDALRIIGRKYHSRKFLFDEIQDPGQFLARMEAKIMQLGPTRFMVCDQIRNNSDAIRVECTMMLRQADGACYVDGWRYRINFFFRKGSPTREEYLTKGHPAYRPITVTPGVDRPDAWTTYLFVSPDDDPL